MSKDTEYCCACGDDVDDWDGDECAVCLDLVCTDCAIYGVDERCVCPDCATEQDCWEAEHRHPHRFVSGLDPRYEVCMVPFCGLVQPAAREAVKVA